ncbi:winged helix-turn-helix transcriptional regulator [Microbacterium deminutum]|uniref:Winged helix-turn-helix transcriptional regulator n=1 Tax=Microbacterium deminutum TaxID=344164 RepID=A0ABP5CZC6_9MICO
MKSYGQICSVARSLDIVGDRWNLLIVRELLITRRLRFTDLQRGLPGVAPNLLAQRLRDLEGHGVLRRETAAPPATGTLYALTDRGAQLEGVVRELLQWGAPTVADAAPDAVFQMHWLSIPARYLTRDNTPTAAPSTIRFGTIADGFDVTVSASLVTVAPCGIDDTPDATINGPGATLVGLLQGAIDLAHATTAGVTIQGDVHAVQRILAPGP